ncbi:MAG: DUF3737 family protein [Methanomethylophilus sp.]
MSTVRVQRCGSQLPDHREPAFCYCWKLVLENCTAEDTGPPFEKNKVRAYANGRIGSVKNPQSESLLPTISAGPAKPGDC